MTAGPMNIRLYAEAEREPFWSGAYLDFEQSNADADEDWAAIRTALRDDGCAWIGGGAAPLVTILAD